MLEISPQAESAIAEIDGFVSIDRADNVVIFEFKNAQEGVGVDSDDIRRKVAMILETDDFEIGFGAR